MLGYHPEVILAGRRINDGMAAYVAQQTVKQLIRAGNAVKGATVTVLGLTFKENCRDLRNSKVADLVRELREFGCNVVVHDPLADAAEAQEEYGIALTEWRALPVADALIAAVSHQEYLALPSQELLARLKPAGIFIDVKSAYAPAMLAAGGYRLWRL